MFELMCWCWSDIPQHRPDFDQILQILKTDTFTHLLAATSITKDNNEITAASLHTVAVRRTSMSSFYTKSSANSIFGMITQSVGSGMEMSASYTGVMSLIYGNVTGGQGEESANQVWYGTDTGRCGIIKFEKCRTDKEVYEMLLTE